MVEINQIRECLCQICNQEYPVWFTENNIWNEVMRWPDGREVSEKYHFVCMNCFAREADKRGLDPRAWKLTVDDPKLYPHV